MSGLVYDAFISYSHQDLKWGSWLQSRLESYPVPADMRSGILNGRSRMKVFRDQTDLAGAELQSALQKELESSRCLIVICSPHSARSRWVNEEIRYFKQLGRTESILPFIVEGEPESDQAALECYPDDLRNLGESHMLGANVREIGRNKAFLKLLAILLNVRFDRLVDREKQRRRRNLFAACSGAFVVASVTAGLIWKNASIARENRELSYDMYGAAVVSMTEKDDVAEDDVATLIVSAEAGNVKAMLMLADCYLKGMGVPEDPEQAFYWNQKAAEAGDTTGMVALANCYHNGTGTPVNPELSFEWDMKAAEAGDSASMVNVGFCYEDGYGVEADPEAAFSWYRKAAEAGNDLGYYHLARCYLTGTGTEADAGQAFQWTLKLAETGNPEGMYNLAMMYQYGYGVEETPRLAYQWYLRSAEAGDADAMYMAGWCMENRYGITDPALDWYEKAAEAGNEAAVEAIHRLAGLPASSSPAQEG